MYLNPEQIATVYQDNFVRTKWTNYKDKPEELTENATLFSSFLVDCVQHFYNDRVEASFREMFSSDATSVSNLFKEIQKNPKLLSQAIKKIRKSIIINKRNFFKDLIIYSLSSKYKIIPEDNTENRIKALIEIKDALTSINSTDFNFKSIINKIIYQDYCCGLDESVCVCRQIDDPSNKILLSQNEENDEGINDTTTDYEKVSNIVTSQEYVNDVKKKSNDVLAFFQNRKNNKLYFSANIKIVYDGRQKTLAQLIVDNFLEYLSPESIERILSTFRLYKEQADMIAININNANKNLYISFANEAYNNTQGDANCKKKIRKRFIDNINQTMNDIRGEDKISLQVDNTNQVRCEIRDNEQRDIVDDKRYACYNENKAMIEKIIKSEAFKEIKIRDLRVLNCPQLKTSFEKIDAVQIEYKTLSEVFFDKFETNDLDVLSGILNMKDFANLEKKQLQQILLSLLRIQYKQDKVRHDAENQKNMSEIIECAKKLYFHAKADEEIKKDIINYVINLINEYYENDPEKLYLIGNSLILDNQDGLRKDNEISIKDYEFLEKIVNNITERLRDNNEEAKAKFAEIFSSALENIESIRVFKLLAQNNLFTERKIITEALDIFYKQEQQLLAFWGTDKTEFLKSVLNYANIKTPSQKYQENLELLSRIAEEKYGFSRPIRGKKMRKEIINTAILMKELASGLSFIDFKNSYDKLTDVIKKANNLYDKIDLSKNIDTNEENEVFKITSKLRKSVEEQFAYAKKIVNKQILNSKNDNDLKKMAKEITSNIEFINTQIKNQAQEKYETDDNIRGCINKKIFGLQEHFKSLRTAYNRFKKYNNKQIKLEEYKKQQKNNILNAKNTLINGLKNMMVKKQKDWNDIFVLNKNNQNSKLTEFYKKGYSDIDNYATQILNEISNYEGTDVEIMQRQARENIEKLEKKILDFDKNIKNTVKVTNSYNENLLKNSMSNSNINNSITTKSDKYKNDIQKSKNKLLNTYHEKQEQALDNIDVKENKIFFDRGQAAMMSATTIGAICLSIASILTGIFIIGAIGAITGIAGNILLFHRKKKNDRKNDVINASQQYEIYKAMFDKADKKEYIKNDKNDNKKKTNDKEKKVLKEVNTNLKDNKKQPQLT